MFSDAFDGVYVWVIPAFASTDNLDENCFLLLIRHTQTGYRKTATLNFTLNGKF